MTDEATLKEWRRLAQKLAADSKEWVTISQLSVSDFQEVLSALTVLLDENAFLMETIEVAGEELRTSWEHITKARRERDAALARVKELEERVELLEERAELLLDIDNSVGVIMERAKNKVCDERDKLIEENTRLREAAEHFDPAENTREEWARRAGIYRDSKNYYRELFMERSKDCGELKKTITELVGLLKTAADHCDAAERCAKTSGTAEMIREKLTKLGLI